MAAGPQTAGGVASDSQVSGPLLSIPVACGTGPGGPPHRGGPLHVHLQVHAVQHGGLCLGAGGLVHRRHPLDPHPDSPAEGGAW